MQDRLILDLLVHWTERWRDADAEAADYYPLFEAAVYGRAFPVLERWSGGEPRVTMPERPAPAVVEQRGGTVYASLGLDWLAAVWARDLALVDGHFVAAVEHVDDTSAEVRALPAPGAAEVTLAVVRDGSGWRRR